MAANSEFTKRLIADGLRRSRVPFDFNRRVKIARIYLDDGAWMTCADRLERLAKEIRQAALERQEQIDKGGRAA